MHKRIHKHNNRKSALWVQTDRAIKLSRDRTAILGFHTNTNDTHTSMDHWN